jgi:NADH dehydrogenase [ubiquinone] 1 alpha subcomplex assembly factor 1
MRDKATARNHIRIIGALTLSALLACTMPSQGLPVSPETSIMTQITLTDFTESGTAWQVVNDGVMGGVSRGAVEVTPDGTMLFMGNISLENNGGFSSCRLNFEAIDMREFDGISLRVRGDGKRYGFNIRAHDRFDGVNHRARFQAEPGAWTEIRIPFSEFRPEFRGRDLPQEPPLDTASIRSIGFIIAEGQEGSFHLEVDRIEAYRSVRD